jgi:hypothetical protein
VPLGCNHFRGDHARRVTVITTKNVKNIKATVSDGATIFFDIFLYIYMALKKLPVRNTKDQNNIAH